jgi:hypothetical protein
MMIFALLRWKDDERHLTAVRTATRLGEVMSLAGKEEREEGGVAVDRSRKIDCIVAKYADSTRGWRGGRGS